ncbi:tRNA 2-selenouridine synthase [Alteribacillus persepolensis]|uniref:tRNA 2-selenouridine synthase n=1 Tax=Alteribacillus persepolensis TaxID=568899 RepID=A0A1G8C7Y4_9BACI|nr:tRNA 2-selenouridine(34) synthase MnmH [Alteribacillus persepolensis]SDH41409.1 tRNA 2-selenouridine synthase [Alteribacillus persepolensis]
MNWNQTQFVDVRSPAEFDEYALPGAVNIPLFTNEERAEVGTIYKKEGKQKAIEKGLEMVGPKLSHFYHNMYSVYECHPEKELVVYCWRGGMRSKSFVSVMNMLGITCKQLPGGIRSIRKRIIDDLEKERKRNRVYYVIAGGTGTAKTNLLHQLQLEGYPVIDLEGLANHRGSAFGQIGRKQHSQKQFELCLWLRLNELTDSPYLIVEAESKRIGTIILPRFIQNGIQTGKRVRLHMPMQERINTLIATYQPHCYRYEIKESLKKIERKLPVDVCEHIHHCLDTEDYEKAAELLLVHYYDPRYEHAERKSKSAQVFYASHIKEHVINVKKWLRQEMHTFATS